MNSKEFQRLDEGKKQTIKQMYMILFHGNARPFELPSRTTKYIWCRKKDNTAFATLKDICSMFILTFSLGFFCQCSRHKHASILCIVIYYFHYLSRSRVIQWINHKIYGKNKWNRKWPFKHGKTYAPIKQMMIINNTHNGNKLYVATVSVTVTKISSEWVCALCTSARVCISLSWCVCK